MKIRGAYPEKLTFVSYEGANRAVSGILTNFTPKFSDK